jgi:hypothetical protein
MLTNYIFNTNQNGKYLFECLNINYNPAKLKLIKTINSKIYIYKNLQLHISENGKQYFDIENGSHYKNNNIIIQKLIISTSSFLLFPLINKYDNIISREIKIYHDTKTNVYLNFITDIFPNKDKLTYIQIDGDFEFDNLFNLLNNIFS